MIGGRRQTRAAVIEERKKKKKGKKKEMVMLLLSGVVKTKYKILSLALSDLVGCGGGHDCVVRRFLIYLIILSSNLIFSFLLL